MFKFNMGQLVATPGAMLALDDAGQRPDEFLTRHLSGDWGDVGQGDAAINNEALKNGGRLLSSYRTAKGVSFWIITEHDRSVTTILLPEDY